MTSTCTICDSTNTKACARCHSTRYCSLECQHTDWPSHRLLCYQYSTRTDRPDPSYKRAILFPPDEVKPKIIWVECKPEENDEVPGYTYTFELPQVREHLGGKLGKYYASPEYKPIKRNLLRGRDLTNTLEVICRETFVIDGSSVNKSVVQATQFAMGYKWRGPILAMKKQGLSIDPRFHLDIDMQDYRDVVDYFISYKSIFPAEDEDVRGGNQIQYRNGRKVCGVKINCEGAQSKFGAPKFAAVDVPAAHPVFSNPVAPTSKLVGMPLHTWQYPPDSASKDNPTNVPATVLHRNTDETSGNWWGWAPMKWQNDVGGVLVVRNDDLDVSVQEVEALCHFCQFKMQPLFENALGGGLVQMSRAEVLAYLTPEGFGEYIAEMRAMKMDEEGEGGGWETAGMPG